MNPKTPAAQTQATHQARNQMLIVALSAAAAAGDQPSWQQILPSGVFTTLQGNEFEVSDAEGLALASAMNARTNELACDYEHSTLTKAVRGEASPASGWFKQWRWDAGKGLFALCAWTDAAKAMIRAGEYKYLSPMFQHVGKKITQLMPAAITNYPAIDGMQPLAASATVGAVAIPNPTKDNTMKELLKRLREALKLGEDATPEQMLAALNQWLSEMDAKPKPEVAAMSASDLANFAPMAVVLQLQAQVAALSAHSQKASADKQIDDALADGRLLGGPMEAWARSLVASGNVAALSGFLGSAKPVAALNGLQSAGVASTDKKTGLNDDERAVVKALGISEEAFLKQRGN